mgnify:CR=1 FL=1|jgi:uncharacterized protein
MKISDKSNIRDTRKGQQPATTKSDSNKLFSLFSSEMNAKQLKAECYDKDIAELRSDLDAAGNSVEHEPTLKNFKHFRNLLSKLAKQVSTEAYRLEKVGGTPMNPRYYEIITIIDKEADKLYELIVKEQKNRMAITASVIGIKGLIVDLIT